MIEKQGNCILTVAFDMEELLDLLNHYKLSNSLELIIFFVFVIIVIVIININHRIYFLISSIPTLKLEYGYLPSEPSSSLSPL
jgi:hypothetical protein